jgi:hypothetical protein
MARKIFHSFRYANDSHRVQQIRNMGVIEGQRVLSANAWEDVKKGGDKAIKAWIDEAMDGRSCVAVLIGSATAGRKWVDYEIKKAWTDGRGVLGVHIHGLKDLNGNQASKGRNPFSGITVGGVSLASAVPTHDTPYTTSTYVYEHIEDNLADWVEKAITIRKKYP